MASVGSALWISDAYADSETDAVESCTSKLNAAATTRSLAIDVSIEDLPTGNAVEMILPLDLIMIWHSRKKCHSYLRRWAVTKYSAPHVMIEIREEKILTAHEKHEKTLQYGVQSLIIEAAPR